jgi:hypothetical protein
MGLIGNRGVLRVGQNVSWLRFDFFSEGAGFCRFVQVLARDNREFWLAYLVFKERSRVKNLRLPLTCARARNGRETRNKNGKAGLLGGKPGNNFYFVG